MYILLVTGDWKLAAVIKFLYTSDNQTIPNNPNKKEIENETALKTDRNLQMALLNFIWAQDKYLYIPNIYECVHCRIWIVITNVHDTRRIHNSNTMRKERGSEYDREWGRKEKWSTLILLHHSKEPGISKI